MLSDSIINTYSAWKNNQPDNQNTFQPPKIQLPTSKYTTTPLGMGSKTISTPYLSNSNPLSSAVVSSKSVSMSVMPVHYNGMYGNYVLIDKENQSSVIEEDGSEMDNLKFIEMGAYDSDADSDSGSDDGEDRIHRKQPYINLDNYKLNDPIIQFYFGSITVIGLFILFRLMSKTK